VGKRKENNTELFPDTSGRTWVFNTEPLGGNKRERAIK